MTTFGQDLIASARGEAEPGPVFERGAELGRGVSLGEARRRFHTVFRGEDREPGLQPAEFVLP